jgi:hypothetical protein
MKWTYSCTRLWLAVSTSLLLRHQWGITSLFCLSYKEILACVITICVRTLVCPCVTSLISLKNCHWTSSQELAATRHIIHKWNKYGDRKIFAEEGYASPQENYTDWATATNRRNLMPTFADRREWRGQRDGFPTVVNLSFLNRSRYFSFK